MRSSVLLSLSVGLSLHLVWMPPSAFAQIPLQCGLPITRHLALGSTDTFAYSTAANSVSLIEATDITGGAIGVLHLEAVGDGEETCTGSLPVEGRGMETIKVSDCIGAGTGDYTIVRNVVSAGPDNCAPPMPCGLSPYVRHFNSAGEVDAYSFTAFEDDRVQLVATDEVGGVGAIRLRVFKPDGELVTDGDSCAGSLSLRVPDDGTYTVLVSGCGAPFKGLYEIGFQAPSCPPGPDISYMGIARADGSPAPPDEYDGDGRPVYSFGGGSGFVVVFEARQGRDNIAVGRNAFLYDPNDPSMLPDLQVLLSRPLGNGSTEVCDKTLPNQGGIPAIPSLDFVPTQAVADAINDFGCRVNDGTGQPQGVSSIDACTLFPDGDYHFVNPNSSIQFCEQIAGTWAFPPGKTIVKVRVRDRDGMLGTPREMAVRIGTNPICPGDCNEDTEVTVNELVIGVNIALGNAAAAECPAFDVDKDGNVAINEILQGVNASLNGCPAGAS